MTDQQLWTVGIGAAGLQLVGYGIYYWKIHRNEVMPNPLTWLMFGYGTMLLFFLEWDSSASGAELLLPLACALCGAGLAVDIWIRSYKAAKRVDQTVQWRRFWPKGWTFDWSNPYESYSFASDLTITFLYLATWIISVSGYLPEQQHSVAALIFLAFTNASTFPGFVPTLRQTYLRPQEEHWGPWSVWTMAYSALFWVSWNSAPEVPPAAWSDLSTWKIEHWSWISLMFYPASNAFMHGWVAYLALPFRHSLTHIVPHPGE